MCLMIILWLDDNIWLYIRLKLLKLILSVSFNFFNLAMGKFKITHTAQIIYILGSTILDIAIQKYV